MKKILYIDMDNVLVDFPTGIAALSDELKEAYKGNYDEIPGIFSLMQPMKGAVEAILGKKKIVLYISDWYSVITKILIRETFL